MDPLGQLAIVRDVGRTTTEEGVDRMRAQLREAFRRSLGAKGDPPPACNDPEEAYFPPGCITRQVHADVPPMLIGGLAALLFQMLHPLAMAGVADHSNYREDPVGRLDRTATFLNTTTFHSRSAAEAAIAKVRRIHTRVVGTASDGRPYAASDPALIAWVHATEVHSFLASWRAFGWRRLSPDRGGRLPGRDVAGGHRPWRRTTCPARSGPFTPTSTRCAPSSSSPRQARSARNFILRGVGRWPHEVAGYGILMAAAQSTLPGWARRQLGLITVPAGDQLMVRPVARALATAMRWVATPSRSESSAGTTTAA